MIKCINLETVSNAAHQLPPLFIQPPEDVLEPGPRGINMRVLIKSAQTNYQFSCVELVLAPKKMAPISSCKGSSFYNKRVESIVKLPFASCIKNTPGCPEEPPT